MSRLQFARAGFAVLFAAVTYLTLTPNPNEAEPGLAAVRWLATVLFGDDALTDKMAHFLAYGALGGSAVLARLGLAGRAWLTPLALAAYGALLEGAQGLGGVRSPELADAFANAAGALIGFTVAAMFMRMTIKGRPA